MERVLGVERKVLVHEETAASPDWGDRLDPQPILDDPQVRALLDFEREAWKLEVAKEYLFGSLRTSSNNSLSELAGIDERNARTT